MAARVEWFGDDVQLKLEGATDEMIKAAAFMVEGQAKVNITTNGQVDTGFMRASVYTMLQDGGAIVGVGADYGIYQETLRPFLYPALERVAQSKGGEVVAAGRVVIGD